MGIRWRKPEGLEQYSITLLGGRLPVDVWYSQREKQWIGTIAHRHTASAATYEACRNQLMEQLYQMIFVEFPAEFNQITDQVEEYRPRWLIETEQEEAVAELETEEEITSALVGE